MSKEPQKYPKDVFVSLSELLRLERLAKSIQLNPSKHKVQSILGGKHASKLRGRGLDFEEVRNYEAGDDIRTIDWKVTARTQKAHTRVYSEEKEKPVLIVLDQSESMFFGSQKTTKSAMAAKLAAIFAFHVVKNGDRVGGLVYGSEKIDYVLPKRDRKNLLRFLDTIVNSNRRLIDKNKFDFENSLVNINSRLQNIVSHDYLVIIISDFHRYSEKVIKQLSHLRQRNDIILIKVYDPMEKDLPSSRMVLGNTTEQISVDARDKELGKRVEQKFDEELDAFQIQMKKLRIPLFKIDTSLELEDQLKEYFKGGRS